MPVYRWTTALNGFAVALTTQQATELASDSRVALVEENAVRRLAGTAGPATRLTPNGGEGGGAGVVVGVVDTGIWPESPLFADSTELGRLPRGFRGTCSTGEDWGAGSCTNKLVAAQWFANGFGEDNLRSASSLSPRDDSGHGTQMASIAAGNAGVSVHLPGQRMGTYAGVAPQAAPGGVQGVWSTPDPRDDGCATADLVTAIDRATRDRVDVLNLAVTGPSSFDTVERALLGATEHGLVVVGAAGNDGHAAYAAHPSPWVLTVGAATGDPRRGRVASAVRWLSGRGHGFVPVGRAGPTGRRRRGPREWSPGAPPQTLQSRQPGRLSYSRRHRPVPAWRRRPSGEVRGRRPGRRGRHGARQRTSQQRRLRSAQRPHRAPVAGPGPRPHGRRPCRTTSQVRARARCRCAHPPPGVTPPVQPRRPDRHAGEARRGRARDLRPRRRAAEPSAGPRWDFVSGTSAATAWTSGLAASLLAQRGWGQGLVRSALATSAVPVGGGASILSTGPANRDWHVPSDRAWPISSGPTTTGPGSRGSRGSGSRTRRRSSSRATAGPRAGR